MRTAERIIFNGEDITDVPMEKRGFNIVFQDYALFPNLNVYQNITYGLRNKPEISSKEEVEELISLLGLEEHLNETDRSALRRTEAESSSGKNNGNEAEDPSSGRAFKRSGRSDQRVDQRQDQDDRQRVQSDDNHCDPRSGGGADAFRPGS